MRKSQVRPAPIRSETTRRYERFVAGNLVSQMNPSATTKNHGGIRPPCTYNSGCHRDFSGGHSAVTVRQVQGAVSSEEPS